MHEMDRIGIEEQFIRYPRLTLRGHTKSSIHSVRWNPEGNLLASCGGDKAVHLHRVVEAELVLDQRLYNNGHSSEIDQICWNPRNSHVLATTGVDKHVKVWDVHMPEPLASVKIKGEGITVLWSNDGNTVAVADKGDNITFVDVRNGFRVLKDQKYPFEVSEIAWNKEDDMVFLTSGEGNVHVLSFPDLQPLLVLDAFASPCICIRFDPTGQCFAVGSNDALASIWDSYNLACLRCVDRLDWPIKSMSFSHDGRYLALGSEDNFIDVANVKTGEREATIDVESTTLTLDFHPKSYILAYALKEADFRDVGSIKIVGFPEERRRGY